MRTQIKSQGRLAVLFVLFLLSPLFARAQSCSTRNNLKAKLGAKLYAKYTQNTFSADTQNDLPLCPYYVAGNLVAAKYGVQLSRLSIARYGIETNMSDINDTDEHQKDWDYIGNIGDAEPSAITSISEKKVCLEAALPSRPSMYLTNQMLPIPGHLTAFGSPDQLKAAFALVTTWQNQALALAPPSPTPAPGAAASPPGPPTRAEKNFVARVQNQVNQNAAVLKGAFPGVDLPNMAQSIWKNRAVENSDLMDIFANFPDEDGLSASYAQLRKLQMSLFALNIRDDDTAGAQKAKAKLAENFSKSTASTGNSVPASRDVYFGSLNAAKDTPALRIFPNLMASTVVNILWRDRGQRFTQLLTDLEAANCGSQTYDVPKLSWQMYSDNLVSNAHTIINAGEIAAAETTDHDMTLIGQETVGQGCYFVIMNNWGQEGCSNKFADQLGPENMICRTDGTFLIKETAFPSLITDLVQLK